MKKLISLLLILIFVQNSFAQKIDSLFFHLYTDSLKRGTYNYINVDGKTSEGKWLPLTAKEITFTFSAGKIEGNNLILEKESKEDSVMITAVLIQNPSLRKTITIYIKKNNEDEKLKTKEEMMNDKQQPSYQKQKKTKKDKK